MVPGKLRRSRLRRALLACLSLAAAAAGAQTEVTLREGTDMHVATDAAGRQLSFDLADMVWVMPAAGGEARSLTPAEWLAARPVLSPDGGQLVFESGVRGSRHLQQLNLETGKIGALTFGNFDDSAATWRPDGRRLAFVSNRGGDTGIWELDLQSEDLFQRSFGAGAEKDPAYDSTGERIAYVAATAEGSGLFVLDREGRATRILSEDASLLAPSWRPDGSLLTYVHRRPGVSELRMVILSDPPVIKALTQGENVFASPARWLDRESFLYAADGRIRHRRFDDFTPTDLPLEARLTVPRHEQAAGSAVADVAQPVPVRGITGYAASGTRRFVSALGSIWELDADGSAVRQFGSPGFVQTQLAGSPDGQRLAFASDRGGELQIWTLDLTDGRSSQLTAEDGAALHPTWHPDSTQIAYLVAAHPDAATRILKVARVDTGETREIARGLPGSASPAWTPAGLLTVSSGAGQLLAFRDGEPAAAPAGLPPGIEAVRWSPRGDQVAWLQQGRLSVAATSTGGGAAGNARSLANGALQPRWIDAGQRLAWLGADGLREWSPAEAEPHSMPVALRWEYPPPARERPLVIRVGKLFDGLGPGYAYAQDIVIEGKRIVSIGPWRDPPPGELLDARMLTAVPGLIDLAVRPDRAQASDEGRAWLAYGVTGVREFSRDLPTTLERRESWASNQRPGPRLFPATRVCGTPGPGLAAAEARLARRMQAVAVELCPTLPGSVQAEWITQAGAAGLTPIALQPFPGALLGAAEVRLFESSRAYPQAANRIVYGDVIDVIGGGGLTAISGLSAIGLPTIATEPDDLVDGSFDRLFDGRGASWYRQSWDAQRAAASGKLRAETRTAGQSIFRAVARGARLVTGSGAPAVPPGLGLQAELRLLRATGLQSFQVLRMATRDAAESLGVGGDLGRLEPGMLADLVLVEGDPLEDIRDTGRVVATVLGGRVYRRQELLGGTPVGNLYSP